ncbi:hypothetical protein [Streptomyces tritici]|uniref:hypothetical protein n=1 Tax=Streptomyces tritici TaxID=2054410 RepID=UPI003AEFCA16
MAHHERRRTLPANTPPRTTPSEAVGESGDEEARREAEEAERGRRGDIDTDDEGRGRKRGTSAERRAPGPVHEEQRRPLGRRGDAEQD